MGNCCKIKTMPYKYSDHDDGSTHRLDGIVLPSDEVITCIYSNLNTWLLGQELSLSIYQDFTLSSTFSTSERLRSLVSTSEIIAYGGKTIKLLDFSGKDRGKLEGHERTVTSLDIYNDLLISGSSD